MNQKILSYLVMSACLGFFSCSPPTQVDDSESQPQQPTYSPASYLEVALFEAATGQERERQLMNLLATGAFEAPVLQDVIYEVPGEGRVILQAASDYVRLSTGHGSYYYPALSHDEARIIASHYGMTFSPSSLFVDLVHEGAELRLPRIPIKDGVPSPVGLWKEASLIQSEAILQNTPQGVRGVLSGHKKDLIEGQVEQKRVAIYGWHGEGEEALQPLRAAHAPSYRDYSQSARLVSLMATIEGVDGSKKRVTVKDLLMTPYAPLVSNAPEDFKKKR